MEQEENKPKYIWEGAVGAKINRRKNGKTGEDFYSFELVRYYTENDSDEAKYSSSFTDRNAQALRTVISKTLEYIEAAKSGNPVQIEDSNTHVIGKIVPVKMPADQVAG